MQEFSTVMPNCACFKQALKMVNVSLLVNAFIKKFRKSTPSATFVPLKTGDNPHSDCGCLACSTALLSIVVKGMNCNHCKSNVDAAIQKVAGVESVEIDLASGRTVIHGSPNKEDVVKAVEALGFSVVEE